MTLVVDASVAVKWVLPELGFRAVAIRATDEDLIAPSLVSAEIGNAIFARSFAAICPRRKRTTYP